MTSLDYYAYGGHDYLILMLSSMITICLYLMGSVMIMVTLSIPSYDPFILIPPIGLFMIGTFFLLLGIFLSRGEECNIKEIEQYPWYGQQTTHFQKKKHKELK